MKDVKKFCLTYHLSLLLVPFPSQFRLRHFRGMRLAVADADAPRSVDVVDVRRRGEYFAQFAQEGAEKRYDRTFGHRERPAQRAVVLGGHEGRRQEVQHW